MKIQVLNVSHAHGISEKTGSTYDIHQLERLVPTEDINSQTKNPDATIKKEYHLDVGVLGFRVESLAISPNIYESFKRDFDSMYKPGVYMHEFDVEIDQRNRRTLVVSYKPVSITATLSSFQKTGTTG
jgi:hypothetical protein